MSTSLAEQLKRLAIPQTKVLLDGRKRASLLFDSQEAAKLSKETIFEIGTEGLKELVKLDPIFSKFKQNLFDSETKYVQRAVETNEVNSKIDRLVSKFLIRLSPYLLLKASHKALEWLIYRYQIHEVNVNQLFALILPYHETNIFVRVLQLFDLKSLILKSWSWLEPMQKNGLHLPRQVLINHAISDSSFLRFICESTTKSLKEFSKTQNESKLRTQFAFYTAAVVGVLSQGSTNDHILTVLLPSLLDGLTSSVADFKAAAFMAVGQLITHNQLEADLCNKLLSILMTDDTEAQRVQKTCLLVILFQRQQPPPTIAYDLMQDWDWVVPVLAEFSRDSVLVGPLTIALVEACMDRVLSQQIQDAGPQVLCWSLVEQVECDAVSASKLLRLLASYYEKIRVPSKEKKRLKSSENVNDAADWLKVLIETLCVKYAEVFDKTQDQNLQNLRREWSGEEAEDVMDSKILPLVRKCAGVGQATAWRHLKPLLLKQIDENKMFKAWCKASPSDEPLTILVILERILRPVGTPANKRMLLAKIGESPYGSRNVLIGHLKKLLDDDRELAVEDAVENTVRDLWGKTPDIQFTAKQWIIALIEMKNSNHFNFTNDIWPIALKMLIILIPADAPSNLSAEIATAVGLTKNLKTNPIIDVVTVLIDELKRRSKKIHSGSWVDLSRSDLNIYLYVKTLELCLHGMHESSKQVEKRQFAKLLNDFLESCFPLYESSLTFVSAISGGLPLTPASEGFIHPLLQIQALHFMWRMISEKGFISLSVATQMSCHLMLALTDSSTSVRSAAVKTLAALVEDLSSERPFAMLLQKMVDRSKEITADPHHLSVALFCLLSPQDSVQKSLGKKIATALNTDREKVIAILNDPQTPLYAAAKILFLMETVTSAKIVKDLVPLALRALSCNSNLPVANLILKSYWQRLTADTAEALEDAQVWDLLKSSLSDCKGDSLSPAVAFLKIVNKELFSALSHKKQKDLFELLVHTRAHTESPSVSSAVAAVCRKIALDGGVVLDLLDKMVASLPKGLNVPPSTVLESPLWRLGTALLELIQSKKKLRESHVLLRPFFTILKFCLDQEEQTTFEYAKQLTLGCVLDICDRHIAGSENIEAAALDVQLIVQCLRASSNPQTHHHALLLLSCLGSIIPVQVMHNMMEIFTFMGSSVARLDDEHSVQVVTKVIDTIVPVLVKSLSSESSRGDVVVAEVLRIFVWTLRDVPQHRRTPLFSRLLNTLDPDRSAWIFLLLLFENYVVSPHRADKNTEANMPASLQLGMELTLSFGPQVVLSTTLKLIQYLIAIPIEKMNPSREEEPMDVDDETSDGLFDVKKHSPKQLRHFTYTLFTFLNSMLADQNLSVQVRELEKSQSEDLESVLKDAIAALLLYTPQCASQQHIQLTKFWKTMVTLGHDVLDRLVTLVSSDTLVVIITKLLKVSSDALRRKAVDLLNVHVQNHRGGFTPEEKLSLGKLVTPLLAVATSTPQSVQTSGEGELIQQTALLSLRLLVKVLAADDPQSFKQVLVEVSKLCKSKGHLLASAALTVADLVTQLKVRAVSDLPNFLPALLKALSRYVNAESTDIVLMSLSAALYRIVEALASFLSPYMDKLLHSMACLAIRWPEANDLNRKLLQIRQKLASTVPHRVLIPSLSRCYEQLIKEGKMEAVGPLLSVLADSLAVVPDVSKLLPDLTPFLIQVLQMRSDAADGVISVSDENVLLVEGYGIDALLPLVLKLSELSFKPLYYQIFHWASEHPHRAISFYRLSSKLAEGLKGLFVLFAGHFLQNAATLLDAVNVNKTEKPYFGESSSSEGKAILLLENIIQTLHTVFLFDSSTFLSKEKFQVLLLPLVDQLDNTLGGAEALENRSERLLIPCLAQMTVATDDTQWKALNYQLLIKTRSPSPMVRIAALKTVAEVAAKLGEDYLPLLPETIGSLAELLEDEDERVEEAMKQALRRMEDDLGQPIREYFQ